jgi:mono/diheme cytochrome c family protein
MRPNQLSIIQNIFALALTLAAAGPALAVAPAPGAVPSAPAVAAAPAHSPDLSDPAMIAAGAKRFNQNCVYCHGNAGSGGKAGSLQNRDDLTKEYVFNTVSNGKTRGSFLMPAWKASFNEQEIWELASYILSLKNVGPQK